MNDTEKAKALFETMCKEFNETLLETLPLVSTKPWYTTKKKWNKRYREERQQWEKMWKVYVKATVALKYLSPPVPETLPDFGDLFTVEEFEAHCKLGLFGDNDGSGYYSNGEKEFQNRPAVPSLIKQGTIDTDYTHVTWFNK